MYFLPSGQIISVEIFFLLLSRVFFEQEKNKIKIRKIFFLPRTN
jgi:hypothetical protein